MNDIELLVDLHKFTDRQGPGSTEETLLALGFMADLPDHNFTIADIGCGSGASALTLAQHTNAHITAVDLFPSFLDRLDERAESLGLSDRMTTIGASMEDLPFEPESFDVIWSEGAIYNMGFEYGISYWRQFLKPGGYLAVSEITWSSIARPQELTTYWQKTYPEIGTPSEKIKLLENKGYSPVAFFMLSQKSWTDHYYKPTEAEFDAFLSRHSNSPEAQAIIRAEKEERAQYEAYKNYYSYGFYIVQKG